MSAVVHNYAVRITRKLKNPDERGNEWAEDEIVNEIAFVEGDRYTCKIEDLVQEFKKIPLPKDIMVELAHNYTGTLPSGCPWGIMTSLTKNGYIYPGDAIGWFAYDSEEKAMRQKFIVQCEDDLSYFSYKFWAESSLSYVDWKQSDNMRKTIEMGQPYGPGRPLIREWWM